MWDVIRVPLLKIQDQSSGRTARMVNFGVVAVDVLQVASEQRPIPSGKLHFTY
jgi:hypothetical protein